MTKLIKSLKIIKKLQWFLKTKIIFERSIIWWIEQLYPIYLFATRVLNRRKKKNKASVLFIFMLLAWEASPTSCCIFFFRNTILNILSNFIPHDTIAACNDGYFSSSKTRYFFQFSNKGMAGLPPLVPAFPFLVE